MRLCETDILECKVYARKFTKLELNQVINIQYLLAMHSQESHSGLQKFKIGVIDFTSGSLGDYLLAFMYYLLYYCCIQSCNNITLSNFHLTAHHIICFCSYSSQIQPCLNQWITRFLRFRISLNSFVSKEISKWRKSSSSHVFSRIHNT